MKRGKKGSHVGVMLSFVIFITFVVFLFVIFESKINFFQDKESYLEFIEKALLEKFDSDLANIEQTRDEYKANYDGLKEHLGIPENIEFAFTFVDEDTDPVVEIVAEVKIPEGINIYTKEVLVLYEENSKAGYLTIKTW